MPTYVTLVNYTEEGIKQLNATEPEEVGTQTRALIEERGGELKDVYLTMGQYDAVAITEFPDDQSAAETLLATGAEGIAETETLTAFSEDDVRDIVGNLD